MSSSSSEESTRLMISVAETGRALGLLLSTALYIPSLPCVRNADLVRGGLLAGADAFPFPLLITPVGSSSSEERISMHSMTASNSSVYSRTARVVNTAPEGFLLVLLLGPAMGLTLPEAGFGRVGKDGRCSRSGRCMTVQLEFSDNSTAILKNAHAYRFILKGKQRKIGEIESSIRAPDARSSAKRKARLQARLKSTRMSLKGRISVAGRSSTCVPLRPFGGKMEVNPKELISLHNSW